MTNSKQLVSDRAEILVIVVVAFIELIADKAKAQAMPATDECESQITLASDQIR